MRAAFSAIASALLLLLAAGNAYAVGIELTIPVACHINKDCFVQNYMDHAPEGQEPHDYSCGSLTNAGHGGTDIRVSHEGLLNQGGGIGILAAAAGTVQRVFNEPPAHMQTPMELLMQGNDSRSPCGTGVVLKHPGNWQTLYCHMKPGSLLVKEGDAVEMGQLIGAMGMSGRTEFPHLHFGVLQYGKPIDPFVGYANGYDCTKPKRNPLWSAEAWEIDAYKPSGILGGGFTAQEVTVANVWRGGMRDTVIGTAALKELSFWGEVYGVRSGDVLRLLIMDEAGTVLMDKQRAYEDNAALVMDSIALDRPTKGWRPGFYYGYLVLTHRDKPYLTQKWWVRLE